LFVVDVGLGEQAVVPGLVRGAGVVDRVDPRSSGISVDEDFLGVCLAFFASRTHESAEALDDHQVRLWPAAVLLASDFCSTVLGMSPAGHVVGVVGDGRR
jgi:hypothetical protein